MTFCTISDESLRLVLGSVECGQRRDGDKCQIQLLALTHKLIHKCLAIRVASQIKAIGDIETLADAILFEGALPSPYMKMAHTRIP